MLRAVRRCFCRSGAARSCIVLSGVVLVVYFFTVIARTPIPDNDAPGPLHTPPAIKLKTTTHSYKESRQVWDASALDSEAAKCGVKCPYGQVSFYVKTGVENLEGPTICYQGKVVMSNSQGNVNRGLNAVFINDKTEEVVEAVAFDTYLDEYTFIRHVKTKVEEGHIVILASYDEITEHLKEDGRSWLKLFGSNLIDNVKFRDAYMFIGQKGLKQGYAIEYHVPRQTNNYANPIEKYGCFYVPLGPIHPIEKMLPQIAQGSTLKVGQALENCGLKEPCSEDSISVMVSSGKESTELPKICVSGNIVMGKDLNDGGRGFNLVIVNPAVGKAVKTSRFDTYSVDSVNLELFLDSLMDGDIIIGVVHDDASNKLGYHAKELLNKLGSSMIQNLKFRDVWYFAGQVGIQGFTTLEKISYAGIEASWPEPLKESFCVPKKIKGQKIIPDPRANTNEAKRAFCTKFDGYSEFCDPARLNDPMIKPIEISDEKFKSSPVYKTPIIIIPGLNHNALVRTMETTIMQPGINLEMVLVTWDEKFPEQGKLATLFGFKNVSLSSSTSYVEQVAKSIDAVWTVFPTAQHVIVIEEELLLAPDFLHFMAQTLPILDKDATLLGISALNFNGYEITSGNRSLVYRTEDFPGLAFLLKKSVYESRMKGNMKSCCFVRAWDSWTLPAFNATTPAEILVPDVSRVYRQPYQGSKPDEQYLVDLFHKPRLTNLDGEVALSGLHTLITKEYEATIMSEIGTAAPIDLAEIHKCVTSKGNDALALPKHSRPYRILYKQRDEQDYTNLQGLCQCFGLFTAQGHKPKSLHKGLLRFYFQGNNIFLIGSSSSYTKVIPQSEPLYQTR